MKLNAVTISKRGKGAKGTVDVEVFGTPVKSKSHVTKKFSYDKVGGVSIDDLTLSQCIDALEQVGKFNQRLLKEAVFRGADAIKKSASIQEQSEKSGIVRFILESDLAMDVESAENLSNVWQQTQSFMKRSMMAVPTIEELSAQRKVYVDGQKEKGLWKTRLVTSEDIVTSDDNDDDTEDSE